MHVLGHCQCILFIHESGKGIEISRTKHDGVGRRRRGQRYGGKLLRLLLQYQAFRFIFDVEGM